MPPDNGQPTRQQMIDGALSSIDELIAAETEKLRLLKLHRQGLIQKFSGEMKTNPPQQHEDAKRIIDFLLEADRRSCGMCEREFGVHDPDASHGNCKRHTIASYQQMVQMNPAYRAQTEQSIRKVEAMPDSAFPPDLAQHPEIVAQLGKKDYASHDQEVKAYMDQFHRARGEQPV
jgi:hypothetical protein